MSAFVADTHALHWYVLSPEKLSITAKKAFEDAADSGDEIFISAISVIEMRYLVEKGKLVEEDFSFILKALGSSTTGLITVPINLQVSLRIP
jgi:PIN domain nuclease of toxin-antitoxin system